MGYLHSQLSTLHSYFGGLSLPKRIAVLVSGGGTNLQALIDAQARGEIVNGEIVLVISSTPSAYALERAAKAGIPSCVVARKEYPSNQAMTVALVDKLKKEREGVIWICGGASVAGQLLKEGRIDRLWLSVIPTVLGTGVRLFPDMEQEFHLKLVGTEQYNGIVDLVYEKR